MSDQTTLRPQELAAIRKTQRAYPHEIRAMVAEIDAFRAGTSNADAQRWQWFRSRLGRLMFDFKDAGEKMVVTSVREMDHGTQTVPASLDEAVDRARNSISSL